MGWSRPGTGQRDVTCAVISKAQVKSLWNAVLSEGKELPWTSILSPDIEGKSNITCLPEAMYVA